MRIRTRIMLLVMPPVIVSLGLAGFILVQQFRRVEALQQLAHAASLTVSASNLIDALQIERDISGIILTANDGPFRTQLLGQRAKSIDTMASFIVASENIGSAKLAYQIDTVRQDATTLAGLRDAVDHNQITATAAFDAYTGAIEHIMDVVPAIDAVAVTPSLGGEFLALSSLMEAKERASQERGLGGQGFSAGRFSPQLLLHLQTLANEESGFLRLFSLHATVQQKNALASALDKSHSETLERLRSATIARPANATAFVPAQTTSWFEATSAQAESLRDIEGALAHRLARQALDQQRAASAWLGGLVVAIGLDIALMGALALVIASSLSRPVTRITQAMTDLAGGNNDIIVPERERRDEFGEMSAAIEVFRANAILHQQSEAQIAYMARHDALTDLPNRLMFQERIQTVLTRVTRARKAAVLCLDLDNFKSVNDMFGHSTGDDLLRAVASRLNTCIAETDLVARLGGDEFAIVQTGAHQPGAAKSLARRILLALAEPFDLHGHNVSISVSIGIAVAPVDGKESLKLLRNADVALFHAKSDGRDTFRFFEVEMDARLRARRQIENDMREALTAEQFELFYQPLIDAQTGQIVSFEALLRWAHPIRGRISPADFVPVAEETGFIVSLGEWALGVACAEAAKWPDHIGVAVNLSPVQFKSNNIVTAVQNALEASGLDPARLGLEVTESLLLQDNEVVLEILHRLRAMGVRISLDDFGTGYSSLSYLRSFPFDKLKIDQCFVRGLGSGRDTTAIVRAVAALGTSMNMKVTAEGVETEEQLHRLQQEGCNEVQGFLFSPPQPADRVPQLLADNRDLIASWKNAAPLRRRQDRGTTATPELSAQR